MYNILSTIAYAIEMKTELSSIIDMRIEERNCGIFGLRRDQYVPEFVQYLKQLRSSYILKVHYFLEVMSALEISKPAQLIQEYHVLWWNGKTIWLIFKDPSRTVQCGRNCDVIFPWCARRCIVTLPAVLYLGVTVRPRFSLRYILLTKQTKTYLISKSM